MLSTSQNPLHLRAQIDDHQIDDHIASAFRSGLLDV